MPEKNSSLVLSNDIPWRLSLVREELTVSANQLTTEQERLLRNWANKGLVKIEKYPAGYSLTPPRQLNEEQSALWDTALPAAEAQLNAALTRFTELPWQREETTAGRYYIWDSELTETQRRLALAAVGLGAMKDAHNGTIFIGYRKDDALYTLEPGSHRHRSRLYDIVDESIQRRIEEDQATLARLPWEFDHAGNLVLDKNSLQQPFGQQLLIDTVEARAGQIEPHTEGLQTRAEEVLNRRGIKFEDGHYVLILPNTTEKLYEAPDGDTNRARIEIYESTHDCALERNRPFMQLPWRFDEAAWSFVVMDTDLSPFQKSKTENALMRQGERYFLESLADYSWKAGGPRVQVEQFWEQLEAAVPASITISDLGCLPWMYCSEGLTVPAAAFATSKFAQEKQGDVLVEPHGVAKRDVVPVSRDWKGDVTLHRKSLAELPFYVAVKREIEKRFEDFVSEHADKIRELPWRFELHDDIRSFHVAHILARDLSPEQQSLVKQLIEQNQFSGHSDREFRVSSERVFQLLEPQFQEWKRQAILVIAAFPWDHPDGGGQLMLPMESLVPEAISLMKEMGFRPDGYGRFSTHAYHVTEAHESPEVSNGLSQAIAENIRARIPASQLPEDIRSLPWQYGGRFNGRDIILDGSKITAEQKARIMAVAPDLHFLEHSSPFSSESSLFEKRTGYFKVTAPGDYYAAQAILDQSYYEALKPVADNHLAGLIHVSADMPWQATENGSYEVGHRQLTKDQQNLMSQLPDDYFDREAERSRARRYSEDRSYVLDVNTQDRGLLEAIGGGQRRALSGPSVDEPKFDPLIFG